MSDAALQHNCSMQINDLLKAATGISVILAAAFMIHGNGIWFPLPGIIGTAVYTGEIERKGLEVS